MAPPTYTDYEPKDALARAAQGTLVVGTAGALLSAVQNSLAKQNLGAMGFITRTGGTIGLFAAMGGTYMFTKTATANLRERDDYINSALGGFLAGAIMGSRFRTLSAVLGYGSSLALAMGVFDYTGGSLKTIWKDVGLDEVSRKEMIRATRQRPVEELISQISESPMVHGPGYEERRKERLKEKYGIVVHE
ncbi:NADH-ubiquinone oxidoreductase 213 kDa subunit [Tirmania nivea]|nr:NADH-ubiquinone oxidoreductase 213 kDa subunit [Tirmania nivea]